LAQSIKDVYQSEGEDILIVEYPCLEDYNVSNHLINEANINIIMLRADKAWKENNKIILEKIKSQAKDSPLNLYLNKAETSVLKISQVCFHLTINIENYSIVYLI